MESFSYSSLFLSFSAGYNGVLGPIVLLVGFSYYFRRFYRLIYQIGSFAPRAIMEGTRTAFLSQSNTLAIQDTMNSASVTWAMKSQNPLPCWYYVNIEDL